MTEIHPVVIIVTIGILGLTILLSTLPPAPPPAVTIPLPCTVLPDTAPDPLPDPQPHRIPDFQSQPLKSV